MTEQDAKTQILTAAMAVFAEKGFAKASMNDIVRQSGLSKGGVYWHFKSKDDLLQTIFDQFFQGQLAFLKAVVQNEGAASTRLLQLATQASADLQTMAGQFPSSLEFYALAARDPALQQLLQPYFAAYCEQLAILVEQGITTGEFRAVPTNDIAQILVGLFEGLILLWAIYPAQVALTQQLETAVSIFLTGLQVPGKL